MSIFFTDSNSELWYTVLDEMGMQYVSMPYAFGSEEAGYDLGRTHDYKKFYARIRGGELPTTMALNPQNYLDIFEPILKKGEDIIYVTFSSGMSGTFQFMQQAIDELKIKYPDRTIKYVDTLSISLGAGLIAYEACKLHNNGASDDEVIEFVKKFRDEVAVYFTANDLMYLKRGGRISTTSAIFGTAIGIKPILSVSEQGKVVAVDKVVGRKKAIQTLVNKINEEGENVADYPIGIIHADCEEDARILEQKVREIVGQDATIWFQPVGPTVGTHCGPDTLGVVFHKKIK